MPEVRLFEYSTQTDVVLVDRETGIIELPRDGGRVSRYLRTDDFDDQGRRLYGLIGFATPPGGGCASCRDPWDLYTHNLGVRMASDEARHALLLRCQDCGNLFEVFPEERATPLRLSEAEARRGFPGAV